MVYTYLFSLYYTNSGLYLIMKSAKTTKKTSSKKAAPKTTKTELSKKVVATKSAPKKANPKKKMPKQAPAVVSNPVEPTPVEATPEMTIPDRIGSTAGSIWHYLTKNGTTPVAQLLREITEDEKIIQRSIGWLAQEGKITLDTTGRGETVFLKD